MNCFTQVAGLPAQMLHALKKINFTAPTPIQAKSIPLALSGRDILGSAQTGTGKTGAFVIPLISKIMNNEIQSALVLTPTRELAVQVHALVESLLDKNSGIRTALLIGGQAMFHQLQQLKRSPRIVVGTPGRINDHIERGTVSFTKTNFLVLDETDRMLDMGFGKQIDSILAHFPEQVQTLMFSATMPKNIVAMSSKYLKNPERIEIGSSLKPIEAIDQKNIYVGEDEKYHKLLDEVSGREGSVIIFIKTKHGAKKMADRLYKDGQKADAIHGDLRQNKRDFVLRSFRQNKFRILVATDVAARGLDVPHIQHVINYDLPQCPEDYIHRVGRTARAGAQGQALNIITAKDERLWRAIERFMKTGEQSANSGYGDTKHRNNKWSLKRKMFKSRRGGRSQDGSSSNGFERRDRRKRFGFAKKERS